jgi:hypothetical protein
MPTSSTTQVIYDKLNGNPYIRKLVLIETGSSIRVTGAVPSFYHKQMAGEAVRAAMRELKVKLEFKDETVVVG